MRQVSLLFFIERGRCHDHAGAAITALERLRVEERLLHRMQSAILRESFDGGHRAPGGTEGRHEAGMNRHAVQPDRTGTTITGVTALLDPKHATLAQKGPQALSGLRLGRKQLAVDIVVHAAVGSADAMRICSDSMCHAPAPGCASSARICSEK